jgi:hypothetical protein
MRLLSIVRVICCPTDELHSGVAVATARKAIQEFDHQVKWKFQPYGGSSAHGIAGITKLYRP